MGCASSHNEDAEPSLEESLHKADSSKLTLNLDDRMGSEDWADVVAVWSLVRSQGAEIDVVTHTFEKIFQKNPRTQILLIDIGILNSTQGYKTGARFRGLMREISMSLNKIIDLKNIDHVGFNMYIQELLELHSHINGFKTVYFEMFFQFFNECLLVIMGPSLSNKQQVSFRKYTAFLSALFSGSEEVERGGSIV